MKSRSLVLLFLLTLAVPTLAACGGGGDSGAEDEITEVIEKVATTSDPKNCTELETLGFTEQNTSAKGKKSTEACEEEAEAGEEVSDGAQVSNISVDGENATADADLEGGALDSQGLELALIEEDGWKVDRIEGFSSYDGEALAKSFARSFEEEESAGEELGSGTAKCITDKIAEASKADAEELFLSGSSKALIALSQSCA